MGRSEACVLTCMCMIRDPAGRVLVLDRRDPNYSGLSFPGGHVEPGESFVDSIIREVGEETGLTVLDPRVCGLKQFRTEEGARYIVVFFRAEKVSGQLRPSEEGDVFWIDRARLLDHRLTPDFELMLQVFENDQISELCYYETPEGVWTHKLV